MHGTANGHYPPQGNRWHAHGPASVCMKLWALLFNACPFFNSTSLTCIVANQRCWRPCWWQASRGCIASPNK